MTMERVEISNTEYSTWIINADDAARKRQFRPWRKLLIACVSLTVGLPLFLHTPMLISLIGFALLIRVPAYCYLAWCDYQSRQEVPVPPTLEWELEDYLPAVEHARAA